jgi:hypothetical protein
MFGCPFKFSDAGVSSFFWKGQLCQLSEGQDLGGVLLKKLKNSMPVIPWTLRCEMLKHFTVVVKTVTLSPGW